LRIKWTNFFGGRREVPHIPQNLAVGPVIYRHEWHCWMQGLGGRGGGWDSPHRVQQEAILSIQALHAVHCLNPIIL
jgi:hypothetical protein